MKGNSDETHRRDSFTNTSAQHHHARYSYLICSVIRQIIVLTSCLYTIRGEEEQDNSVGAYKQPGGSPNNKHETMK